MIPKDIQNMFDEDREKESWLRHKYSIKVINDMQDSLESLRAKAYKAACNNEQTLCSAYVIAAHESEQQLEQLTKEQ